MTGATRIAGVVRWLLLGGAAILAVWSWTAPIRAKTAATADFICPMHHGVQTHAPGICPICQMALVPGRADNGGREHVIVLSPEDEESIALHTALAETRAASPLRVSGVVVPPESTVEHVHTSGATMTDTAIDEGTWEVHAPVAGVVDRVTVRLGARVKKGDELCVLAPSVRVLAPGNGTVTSSAVDLGGAVARDAMLFGIVDLARVAVVAEVSRVDLSRAPMGAAARFVTTTDNAAGRVVEIYPPVDPTGARRIRVALVNPRGDFVPGQYGTLEIADPKRSVVVVPKDSVMTKRSVSSIFVGENGRYRRRIVTRLSDVGDRVEVEGDVRGGERVVSSGVFLLDAESER